MTKVTDEGLLDGGGDPAWSKLLDDNAVSVKIEEESPKESSTSSDLPPPGMPVRKESIFNSFHRQLRMSLKAVSESPGPISRYSRYRQERYSARRMRKRVIFKHGECNVVQGNVAKRRRRYMQDLFTTLVDAQWRWTLMVFSMSFLLSWTSFALIWWLISYTHGDLEALDEPLLNSSNSTEPMKPCITNINGFMSCFLFSVETQHTIGYGNRYINEECPAAIFTMCLQSIAGVFIQAFMVGIVFAKLSRPKKRAQTLLFSRCAVICHRDGIPCLMFRVGDMRKSHIIEAHVRAQIIRKKVTRENEVLPFHQEELAVGTDGKDERLMFIWPTTIVHRIDKHSPLYNLSAQDLLKERFEIVVMLEGVVESTGMTTQARSSYLPTEIYWGHRFEHIVSFRKESGEYEVNYTLFNNTYEVDTPLCSSKQLDVLRSEMNSTANGLDLMHGFGGSAMSLDAGSDSSSSSGDGPIQMRSVRSNSTGLITPHRNFLTVPDSLHGSPTITSTAGDEDLAGTEPPPLKVPPNSRKTSRRLSFKHDPHANNSVC